MIGYMDTTRGGRTVDEGNELGRFVLARMNELGLGLNETARKARISSAALSTMTRGLTIPRAGTLKALADALAVQEQTLLHLAGFLEDTHAPALDPGAAELAGRISGLPANRRGRVIAAMSALVEILSQDDHWAEVEAKIRREDAGIAAQLDHCPPPDEPRSLPSPEEEAPDTKPLCC